jgi:glycosidase
MWPGMQAVILAERPGQIISFFALVERSAPARPYRMVIKPCTNGEAQTPAFGRPERRPGEPTTQEIPMPKSLSEKQVAEVFAKAAQPKQILVTLPGSGKPRLVTKPFPSPVDWRDHWIYFLMVDRFNNPVQPPARTWDRATGDRQGGTFEGIRQQLACLKDLGAGAIWLTPVLRNPPWQSSHHGYGIQDFLEVDPRFGSTPANAESEFIRLIDEAHAHGLRVILDVVINHAGDVFAYTIGGKPAGEADWSSAPYPISWRDGQGQPTWPVLPGSVPRDAAIWPMEFQREEWFRRQGKGGPIQGDFASLKEFQTELTDALQDKPVWNLLIRAWQYAIARFDVDGFRIDTLKHVEREFALTFCNAVREFACAIGKENFFIFGEIKSDDEQVLAAYTGRYTTDVEGRVGADAALDFPLQWKLGPVTKGLAPPTLVSDVFDARRQVQQGHPVLSTHGDASRFFVTFLDNHDDAQRYLYPRDGKDYSHQLTLALGCLLGLQGIPCLYYGTEQGLQGTRELYDPNYDPGKDGKPESVREALWGKPNAFDPKHPIYQDIRRLASVRAQEPALRFGRQYFRPVSGNNEDFGLSRTHGGIMAFSRILNDREVVCVANTSVTSLFSGWVLIDPRINDDQCVFHVRYSNLQTPGSGAPVSGNATFHDANGSVTRGWARRLYVKLAPMEIQILAP